MGKRKQSTEMAEEGPFAGSDLPPKPDPLKVAEIVQQSRAHFRERLASARALNERKSQFIRSRAPP